MTAWNEPILDALYGDIGFDEPLTALLRTPTLQRLRHVRLSNIDSLDMPSIANLSRYEHVVGVAHLAGLVGFRAGMSPLEDLTFRAASLLHDWAITSYGHLVEEALQYVGTEFDHEEKLRRLRSGDGAQEVGGADLQILSGRESGIGAWARSYGGSNADALLDGIMDNISGRGRYGHGIAGAIDLDNMDNVCRMAFHMGLAVDRRLPSDLAKAMVVLDRQDAEVGFKRNSERLLVEWLSTRRRVYERLMLSERDFAGKVMLLHATVEAFAAGEIIQEDWTLVDHEFIQRLSSSRQPAVKDTVGRWLTGELWDMAELHWMSGRRPDYPALLEASREIGDDLGRVCFIYAIKDKRDRRLEVQFDDGSRSVFGEDSDRWLVGVGSPKRAPFAPAAVRRIIARLQDRFGSMSLGPARRRTDAVQESLF